MQDDHAFLVYFSEDIAATPGPSNFLVTNDGSSCDVDSVESETSNSILITCLDVLDGTVILTVVEPPPIVFLSADRFDNASPYPVPFPIRVITNVTRPLAFTIVATFDDDVTAVEGTDAVTVTKNGVNDPVDDLSAGGGVLGINVTGGLVGAVNVLTIHTPNTIRFAHGGYIPDGTTHTVPG